MIKEAISKLVDKKNLTKDEAKEAMSEIMKGETTPSQLSAFITALRMKTEVVDEITGCAEAMRNASLKLDINANTIVDTCGTGGDGTNTFNISTAVALVAAGGELTVAKHGNRSASSQCGSADVLEYLGVNINTKPEKAKECIEKIGIGFLFAQIYHPAMKYAMPTRKELGIRTIFNILGPLTNPAGANVQLLGVPSADLTEMIANVLKNLGTKASLVVHGEGFDEISTTDKTLICEIKEGKVKTYHIQPEDFGIPKTTLKELQGGDVNKNVHIMMGVLKGKKGPHRDIVLLNAGALFYIAGKTNNIKEGIKIAEESIDSGNALNKLKDLIKLTNE
ncbi:MAG: anthranilate phosphoribosyltransferase [Candidatus Omnitrophica bacterium]|nr:anthranilate phosphoribosyltransferase [Candidatus Omnitrophota bacterium]